MERRTIVLKLRTLREEMEADGISTLDVVAPVALILSDVCNALELSQAEHDLVLGSEATEAIEEWGPARLWQLTDKGIAVADKLLAEKETATAPLTEMAAVPA